MTPIDENREFDSPWKETLEQLLEELLRLFFPDLHAAIDWSKGYQSLDAELQEIIRGAELGTKLADKLVRVTLHDGQDAWLLIHMEVQAQPDPEFARRMFVSYYRINERYNQDVVSLAILGDESASWRPDEYYRSQFGCEVRFRFPTVKLLDWIGRENELLHHTNPIGLVALAHLKSITTHKDPERRLQAKRELMFQFYERGWNDEHFRQMYRIIDWLLELPKELQTKLRNEMYTFEKEKKMPYITSTERMAREEGLQQGVVESLAMNLEAKFGDAGTTFAKELQNVSDLNKLREIQRAVIRSTKTIDDLRAML